MKIYCRKNKKFIPFGKYLNYCLKVSCPYAKFGNIKNYVKNYKRKKRY